MAFRRADDSGSTLAELLVSMSIMTVVMTIFTAGIVRMYRTANTTEVRAIAQTQLSLALLRLDRQVRYAAGIGLEYSSGADRYVEYLVIGTGGAQCYRLRLSGGRLQQRTWPSGSSPTLSWTTQASNLTSTYPFRRIDADDAVGFQRLEVDLATAGAGSAPATKIRFTALNTSREPITNTCDQGRGLP